VHCGGRLRHAKFLLFKKNYFNKLFDENKISFKNEKKKKIYKTSFTFEKITSIDKFFATKNKVSFLLLTKINPQTRCFPLMLTNKPCC